MSKKNQPQQGEKPATKPKLTDLQLGQAEQQGRPNTSASVPSLSSIRQQINAIDKQLLELINRRAVCAQETATIKSRESLASPLYRPDREAQILRAIMEDNEGPLQDEEVARLFREIMSACLALEQPTRVAYLGPEGTFTQQAALKHFGDSSITIPMALINEVFREVESGSVQYGVVPVENSSEGVVNNTLDCFLFSKSSICGEVELRIHQNLIISDISQANNISRIYSHSQSLAQCRKWLQNNYPQAERIAVPSNAEAARRIQTEWNSAAIAGLMASKLYNLNILHEKIEDDINNTTRFWILGNQKAAPSGIDKTSLIVSSANKPGALYELLEPFREQKINLTRLETRPSPSSLWGYVFFIDFNGHQEEPRIQKALKKIKNISNEVKILGSYPKAVL